MRETFRDQVVASFLNNLSRELLIEGVPEDKQPLILEEVHSHILEAMDAENAVDFEEAKRVLLLFGNEKKFARSLAAEYRASNRKKPFLWPCVVLLAAYLFIVLLGFCRLDGTRYALFLHIMLVIAIPSLGWLGYRARRPLLGQFGAFAAIWIVGFTGWYAIACVPMGYGPEEPRFAEPVPRWGVASERVQLYQYIARNSEASREISTGKRFYAEGAASPIPPFLRYGDRYLLPVGVQDAARRLPFPLTDSLRVAKSLQAAEKGWNGAYYPGGPTEADRTKDLCDRDVRRLRYNLWFLDWIQRQPLLTLAYDFKMALMAWATFPIAAAITNVGWVIWFLGGTIQRQIRRIRHGQGRLSI